MGRSGRSGHSTFRCSHALLVPPPPAGPLGATESDGAPSSSERRHAVAAVCVHEGAEFLAAHCDGIGNKVLQILLERPLSRLYEVRFEPDTIFFGSFPADSDGNGCKFNILEFKRVLC
jgi:hypothetical protein